MVYTQLKTRPEEWAAKNSLGFEIQTDHLTSARRPDQVLFYKKKKKKKKKKRGENKIKRKEI